jgi:hypothetical protein
MEKKLDYGIDLMSVEHYDCAHENVWNFNGRGWKHEGHGIDLNLSNMLSGFNLTLFGKSFTTAEAAYICGFYSNEDVRCQEIQEARNCLIEGVAPEIDYDLLNGADIYWWGEEIAISKGYGLQN